MTEPRPDLCAALAHIKTIVPDPATAKRYLEEVLDDALDRSGHELPLGIVDPKLLSSPNALSAARLAIEHIDDIASIKDVDAFLDALSTVIRLIRPIIPIQDLTKFSPEHPEWKSTSSSFISGCSRCVGQLELWAGGLRLRALGTGTLLARASAGSVIVTSKHVVSLASFLNWPKSKSVDLKITFSEHPETHSTAIRYNIRRQRPSFDSSYDVAALEIDNPISYVPPPVMCAEPDFFCRRTIGLIGFPHFTSTMDPLFKLKAFGDVAGKKCISFGFANAIEPREWDEKTEPMLIHDATTFSGSSGSCLVSVADEQIMGIHFGGWLAREITLDPTLTVEFFESNGAVPVWRVPELITAYNPEPCKTIHE